MTSLFNHLRRKVCIGATEGLCSMLREVDMLFRKTKVCQQGVALLVKDDIVWLEISIDHIILMKRFQGENDFADVELCLPFRDDALDLNILIEISTWTVVTHKEQLVDCLECVPQSHNEGMLHLCHHISLSDCILSKILLLNLRLAEYFHRKLLLV